MKITINVLLKFCTPLQTGIQSRITRQKKTSYFVYFLNVNHKLALMYISQYSIYTRERESTKQERSESQTLRKKCKFFQRENVLFVVFHKYSFRLLVLNSYVLFSSELQMDKRKRSVFGEDPQGDVSFRSSSVY